jgi:hypothetical protein
VTTTSPSVTACGRVDAELDDATVADDVGGAGGVALFVFCAAASGAKPSSVSGINARWIRRAKRRGADGA